MIDDQVVIEPINIGNNCKMVPSRPGVVQPSKMKFAGSFCSTLNVQLRHLWLLDIRRNAANVRALPYSPPCELKTILDGITNGQFSVKPLRGITEREGRRRLPLIDADGRRIGEWRIPNERTFELNIMILFENVPKPPRTAVLPVPSTSHEKPTRGLTAHKVWFARFCDPFAGGPTEPAPICAFLVVPDPKVNTLNAGEITRRKLP